VIARRATLSCSLTAAVVIALSAASLLSPAAIADQSAAAASLQATRLPTVEQLRCSDPVCTQGLLVDPIFTGMEFRDDRIIGGGAFADAAGYRSKISAFWSDVPPRQSVSGGIALSINLVAFTTVAKARNAVIADASSQGIRLSKAPGSEFDGSWLGDTIAPDGTRLRYAYVVTADAEPSVVRGVCALWGASRRSATCSSLNLFAMISGIARRPAATPPPLALAQPPGLNIVLTATVFGPSAWAAESPDADLLASMADATTTVAQYVPTSQASMSISLRSVPMASGSSVGKFVDSPCEPALPGTICRSEKLPNGGALKYTSLRNDPRKVVQMQVRALTGPTLVVVDCSRPRDFSALTAIQQRSCRTLGAQLAAQQGVG